MRKAGIGYGLAALLALGSASAASAAEQALTVGPFTRVEAAAGMTVTIAQGPQAVVLTGDANNFDRVEVRVEDGALQIRRHTRMFDWGPWRGEVGVRVSMPQIEALKASSGAEITAREIQAGAIALRASSGGVLEIDGVCTEVEGKASSGGELDAERLICAKADGEASSGGDVELHATAEAHGRASSGGSVRISGGASVTSQESSSGGGVRITK